MAGSDTVPPNFNYAKFTGIHSIPAAIVLASLYIPLLLWFLRQSFARPNTVHFVLTFFCSSEWSKAQWHMRLKSVHSSYSCLCDPRHTRRLGVCRGKFGSANRRISSFWCWVLWPAVLRLYTCVGSVSRLPALILPNKISDDCAEKSSQDTRDRKTSLW